MLTGSRSGAADPLRVDVPRGAVLLLAAIRFYPTAEAFSRSLTNWNIVGRMRFVGLANYARLFADPMFWKVMGNTFLYLGLGVDAQHAAVLLVAYHLDRVRFGHGLLRALYFVPHLTTAVAMAWVWRWFYQPLRWACSTASWSLGFGLPRCRSCAPRAGAARPCSRPRSGPASGSRS